MAPLVFELIAMLALFALGFVFGRIWEIRQKKVQQRPKWLNDKPGFEIPIAHLPIPLRPAG